MKYLSASLTWLLVIVFTAACSEIDSSFIPEQTQKEQKKKKEQPGNTPGQETQTMTIQITVGNKVFKADIEASETGKAFIAKLPLTLDMSELNGNEKYCYGVELPHADKRYDSLSAGDLMLFSGNCIVLFYGSAGGYSYTRIGKLSSTEGLKEALGNGRIHVTFAKL